MTERYVVIMAGGGGTRFWPLSRKQKPKQLINIIGNDVMINETIRRIAGLVPVSNILVVANQEQQQMLEELITPDVPKENILLEPVSRNTAPCIAYASLIISSRHKDSIMCVLPSDHYIEDEKKYRETLEKAFCEAEKGSGLITIGIKPTFPSTGYGYIRCGEAIPGGDVENEKAVYAAEEFIEKPAHESAKRFLETGSHLWNSGIFIWKTSVILENYQRFLPRVLKDIKVFSDCREAGDIAGAEAAYSLARSISLDYGILERSDEVFVIPAAFGWNDVGSWDSLGKIFSADQQGNIIKAKHVGIETKNSIIYGAQRLITTIGIDGMIIADTPDALLICPKERSQEVREIVDAIHRSELKEYA